jgi:hypothetical protein
MVTTTLLGALSFSELWADYSAELSVIILIAVGLGAGIGLVVVYLKNYRHHEVYFTSYVDPRMTSKDKPVWEFRRYGSLVAVPELPGMAAVEIRRTDVPVREKGKFYFALTFLEKDTIDIVPHTVRRNPTKKRQFHELQTALYLLRIQTPVTITVRLRPRWTLCNYVALVVTVALGVVASPLTGAYYGILVAMLPLGLCIAILVCWIIDYHIHPATEQAYCQYLLVNPHWPIQDVVGFTVKFWDLEKRNDPAKGSDFKKDGDLKTVGELREIPASLTQLQHMISKLHRKTIKIFSVDLELTESGPKVIKEDYGTSLVASRTPVKFRSLIKEIAKVKTKNSVLEKRLEDLQKDAIEAEINAAAKKADLLEWAVAAILEIQADHRDIFARSVGVKNQVTYERTYHMGPHAPEEAEKTEIRKEVKTLGEKIDVLADKLVQQTTGLVIPVRKKRWWRRGK